MGLKSEVEKGSHPRGIITTWFWEIRLSFPTATILYRNFGCPFLTYPKRNISVSVSNFQDKFQIYEGMKEKIRKTKMVYQSNTRKVLAWLPQHN